MATDVATKGNNMRKVYSWSTNLFDPSQSFMRINLIVYDYMVIQIKLLSYAIAVLCYLTFIPQSDQME